MAKRITTRNKYYNPNPSKKDNRADCVIRAICKATGKDWLTVFDELTEISREVFDVPNSNNVWKEYMNRYGFIKHKITIKKGSTRPTVMGFAEKNKKGIYILHVANHLVCSYDGYYFDTWDSGYKSLYEYFEYRGDDKNE